MTDQPTASRRVERAFTGLLAQGVTIAVWVMPRAPGVVLPERLRTAPGLQILDYSQHTTVDLEVSGRGIAATLYFGGVPHRTYIPWYSVGAVGERRPDGTVHMQFVLAPDLMPQDPEKVKPKLRGERPYLKLVR